jgi:carbon monoxide dehydrogenase subunit G
LTKLITGTHSFTKNYNDTKIEVYVNSRFLGGTFTGATGISFQVKVDNNITPNFGGHGAITASNTIDFLSIYAVFQTLTAGTHLVSLWSRTNSGSSSSVVADPGGWGGTIIVKESW